MKNPFEYLKIDGRGQLPEPWSDYPVLTEYETVPVYCDGRDYVDVFVGQQDGWWVCGVHMNAHGSGSGFYPGRKWGQFATRDNALLWGLGWILSWLEEPHGAIQRAVRERIDDIRQLKIFWT